MNPWRMHSYDMPSYQFDSLMSVTLDEPDLTALTADGPKWTDRDDQKSPWHRLFYDRFHGWPVWRRRYNDFIENVVTDWMTEPFYFQAVPTFRVHLPGNVAVGTFHTDATYHHPLGEETFWLPLTDAVDTSSVWVADDDDVLQSFIAHPGQVVQFSAVSRRHGNKMNTTGRSRVSFDFRCLPARLLPDVEGPPSEHAKLRFIPGGYYSTKLMGA